ncbi:MAG: hypothetical protein ABL891_20140, partial [Burkholderiales bacterium]
RKSNPVRHYTHYYFCGYLFDLWGFLGILRCMGDSSMAGRFAAQVVAWRMAFSKVKYALYGQ